jgi:hypothetical protein
VALYIPAGRRRKRLIVVGVIAAVVGLALGLVLGRVTAPTVDDKVASVQAEARSIDARLQALPVEYEQSLSGGESFANGGGPVDALDGIVADTSSLGADTPWVSPTSAAAAVGAVTAAQQAAKNGMSPEQFAKAIDVAAKTVDVVFGVPDSGTAN